MLGIELVLSSAFTAMQAEIAIAEQAHRSFEDKIKDLPDDKKAEMRALRQIALESRNRPQPIVIPQQSNRGLLGFIGGLIVGEIL